MGYAGFGGGVSSLLTLASGEITYVEDVFSTYLYNGTSANHTITNGIDLAGDGGMTWIKKRNSGDNNEVFDTVRGAGRRIRTDSTAAQTSFSSTYLNAFNSNGFTVGADGGVNQSNNTYCSWTFRKCRGFFDIVTYTGNTDANQQISHNLGSVPGMIVIKRTDATSNWTVWHRSTTGYRTRLNTPEGQDESTFWAVQPTDTHFTCSNDDVSADGGEYVAYLFAHNDGSFGEDSDEAVIKCGQFEASPGTEVNLGFEPQWVLVKRIDGSRDWFLIDNMRGMSATSNVNSQYLSPNDTGAETDNRNIFLTSTGFKVADITAFNNDTHIYMAIRRPHKAPEAGTDVFTPIAADAPTTSNQRPEKVDMYMFMKRGGYTGGWEIADRIRGFQATNANSDDSYTTPTSVSSTNAAETTSNNAIVQQQNFSFGGPYVRGISSGNSFINYMFKRAPGFFDIVAYTGSNSAQNITHNLGVKPALIICKRRNSTGNWQVYADVPAGGATKYLMLDDTSTFDTNTNSNRWNNTEPTATQFTVGTYSDLNTSGGTYFAYLFGNLDGICKIGQYTGTGNDITIDCGFNPRFIMIKQITNQGDGWYVFDSARGINAGNDPWLRFNQTNTAEITNTDIVDPTSGGFIVQAGSGSRANDSDGRKYLYWAIA